MRRPQPGPILLLSEHARHEMTCAAHGSHPIETGGVLVGVHVNGQPWVTAAVEIPSPERGRRHYKIPAGTTQPAVLAAREADHRLGYLGDWHSHPNDSGPSPTDLATLALISIKHPREPNPTMIVVRRSAMGYKLDARRILAAGHRTCEISLTGDLPPSATSDRDVALWGHRDGDPRSKGLVRPPQCKQSRYEEENL